jgi:AraC-like DNA-binding protein
LHLSKAKLSPHRRSVPVAKEKMFAPTKLVSEVTYELGFKYTQHFICFFKQRIGLKPQE